jgi:hypothetical protein
MATTKQHVTRTLASTRRVVQEVQVPWDCLCIGLSISDAAEWCATEQNPHITHRIGKKLMPADPQAPAGTLAAM